MSHSTIRHVLRFCRIVRAKPDGLENPDLVLKSLQRTLICWRRERT